MHENLSAAILCPKCEGNILEKDNSLVCSLCHYEIRTHSGMYSMCDNNEYYWGEIPKAAMDHVLDIARNYGWRASINEIIRTRYAFYFDSILGEHRIDWINLGPRENLSVLDIGSGWGQNVFLMARYPGNRVISVEKIPSRAEFQAIRRCQDKVGNLAVINGDIRELKLKANSLDLVTLCGTLEWIAIEETSHDPRSVQIEVLKKINDALRASGRLVIGIENRLGFNNFLGSKDHSGLRFTSLMPRGVANLYLALRRPSYRSNMKMHSYRTYTYSARGYECLLKEAGFTNIEILIAHPSYSHPRCLIEKKNVAIERFFKKVYRPSSVKDAVSSMVFFVLSLLRIANLFAPHFIIIATRERSDA